MLLLQCKGRLERTGAWRLEEQIPLTESVIIIPLHIKIELPVAWRKTKRQLSQGDRLALA